MPRRKLVPDVISNQLIVSLPPSATALQAAQLMTEHRIGAILIVERNQLKGIFTERDVTTRIVNAGRNPSETALRDVMTANPDTLPPDAIALDALDLMEENRYRHLPIVKDGVPVGMVSIRDLFAVNRRQLEQEVEEREAFIFGSSYSASATA